MCVSGTEVSICISTNSAQYIQEVRVFCNGYIGRIRSASLRSRKYNIFYPSK